MTLNRNVMSVAELGELVAATRPQLIAGHPPHFGPIGLGVNNLFRTLGVSDGSRTLGSIK